MFTDSSNLAAAGVYRNKWTVVQFNGQHSWMRNKTIAWRELLAVAVFGTWLRNKDLIMNINNMAIHECVNTVKSKDPEIMSLIRALYFYMSIYNICYASVHMRSELNELTDSLSQNNMSLFRKLSPNSDTEMTPPKDLIYNL